MPERHKKKKDAIHAKELIELLDEERKQKELYPNKKIRRNKKLTKESKKSGPYSILSYEGKDKFGHSCFKIRFKNTKYETITNIGLMNKGDIKDPFMKSVLNIACLGDHAKEYRSLDPELYEVLNKKWNSMLRRCYSQKDAGYELYGKLGVSVSKRWLNFSNFWEDAQKLPGYDRENLLNGSLTLDKDAKQVGVPIYKVKYSKKTCIWLTMSQQRNYLNTH